MADQMERRMRPIFEAVDSRNYKQAVKLATQLLSKTPNAVHARTIRAMALEKLGRSAEALEDCQAVQRTKPDDESLLSHLYLVYRSLDRLDLATQAYADAFDRQPSNEDLGAGLFYSHVREFDYKQQQQTAMRLWKSFNKPRYFLWAIASIYMQAVEPTLNPVMLGLCASFLAKAHEQKHLTTLEHVLFYVETLERQNKHQQALDLLEVPEFAALFKLRYELKQTQLRLETALQRTDRIIELQLELLDLIPDEWKVYRDLIALANETTDDATRTRIVAALAEMRNKRDETGKVYRSAHLAALHEELQLRGGAALPSLIVEYYRLFGDKLCFFGDIEPYLGSVTVQVLEQLAAVDGARATAEAGDLKELVRTTYRLVSIEKVRRFFAMAGQWSESLDDKLARIERMLQAYRESLATTATPYIPAGIEGEKLSGTLEHGERQHGDDLLLLSVHALLDLYLLDAHAVDARTRLLEALVLLEQGLRASPHNFSLKLLAIRVYCVLGASVPARLLLVGLDLKHIQLDTTTHLVLDDLVVTASIPEAIEFTNEVLRFHVDSRRELAELATNPYRHESFTRTKEFCDFRDKLSRSRHKYASLVENTLLRLGDEFHYVPSMAAPFLASQLASIEAMDFGRLLETCDNSGNDSWHSLAELSSPLLASAFTNRLWSTKSCSDSITVLRFRVSLLKLLAQALQGHFDEAAAEVSKFAELLEALNGTGAFDATSVRYWQAFAVLVAHWLDGSRLFCSITANNTTDEVLSRGLAAIDAMGAVHVEHWAALKAKLTGSIDGRDIGLTALFVHIFLAYTSLLQQTWPKLPKAKKSNTACVKRAMRDIKAPLKANQVAIGSLATELSALLANATVAEQSAEALSSSVSYFQTEDAVKLLGTINTAVGDSVRHSIAQLTKIIALVAERAATSAS